MPTRRLDDRIREICTQLAAAEHDPKVSDEALDALLRDLRSAIHKKVETVRANAARKLLHIKDADLKDRRMHP